MFIGLPGHGAESAHAPGRRGQFVPGRDVARQGGPCRRLDLHVVYFFRRVMGREMITTWVFFFISIGFFSSSQFTNQVCGVYKITYLDKKT